MHKDLVIVIELEYQLFFKQLFFELIVESQVLQLVARNSLNSYAIHVFVDFFDFQVDHRVSGLEVFEVACSLGFLNALIQPCISLRAAELRISCRSSIRGR